MHSSVIHDPIQMHLRDKVSKKTFVDTVNSLFYLST